MNFYPRLLPPSLRKLPFDLKYPFELPLIRLGTCVTCLNHRIDLKTQSSMIKLKKFAFALPYKRIIKYIAN